MTRRTLALFLMFLLTTGCATMLHGTRKKISIQTDPPGATATIGNQTITTPGALKIKRDRWDHFLVISKPGYLGKVFLLKRESSPLVGLNVILLYGSSTAIRTDMQTGGAWTVKPGKLLVKLDKIGEGEPTVLENAEEKGLPNSEIDSPLDETKPEDMPPDVKDTASDTGDE